MGLYRLFSKMPIPLLLFMLCNALIILTINVSVLMGWSGDWVYVLGYGGPVISVIAIGCYIVFIDSKKRWPGLSAWHRWVRVSTFYSD